jgi:DNA (cytosine-5)-methyltransferase 1
VSKPRLLDAFCGAGGASVGYARAGFEVVGVDIAPQRNYPFEFHQADALEYIAAHGHEFDAIHASPECEGYSHLTPKKYRANHPLQIGDVRALLQQAGKPYVIENVSNARHELHNPLMLCGSMFGLKIWRHRFFEVEPPILLAPASCYHNFRPIPVNSSSGQRTANTAECREGLDMPWASRDEIRKAIPPAYTAFLGAWLMAYVRECAS